MKKSIKKVIIIHLIVAGIIIVYYLLPFGCPFKYIFHIPCPTCGMTRSAIELLHGNISESLHQNPMTVPFGLLLFFGVHKDLIPIGKKKKDIIIIIGSIIIFLVYLIRLFYN